MQDTYFPTQSVNPAYYSSGDRSINPSFKPPQSTSSSFFDYAQTAQLVKDLGSNLYGKVIYALQALPTIEQAAVAAQVIAQPHIAIPLVAAAGIGLAGYYATRAKETNTPPVIPQIEKDLIKTAVVEYKAENPDVPPSELKRMIESDAKLPMGTLDEPVVKSVISGCMSGNCVQETSGTFIPGIAKGGSRGAASRSKGKRRSPPKKRSPTIKRSIRSVRNTRSAGRKSRR